MIRLAFLVALLALVRPAGAQNPYWNLAPLRYGLEARMTELEQQDVHLSVDRSVPLDFFLPNVGPGSRIDVLGAALGVRIDHGDYVLRWRVAPLDLDLTRPPWTGGMSVLRYDRTQTRQVVADWFAVHAGPAARLSLGAMSVEPAVFLRGALASRRTGGRVFGGSRGGTDDLATGLAGSATARLVISTPNRSMLQVTATVEKLWGGNDPQFRSLEADIVLTGGPAWAFTWNMALQEVRIPIPEASAPGGVDVMREFAESVGVIGFTLRFTPGSGDDRTF